MNGSLFVEYLKWMDSQVCKPSLLIVDNCPSHLLPEGLQLRNLRLHFLPPNVTSVLQPCDAGIIKQLKALYRKRLVRRQIEAVSKEGRLKKIDLLEAIEMIASSWQEIQGESIQRCWRHTQLISEEQPQGEVQDYREDEELYEAATTLCKIMCWEEESLSEYVRGKDDAPAHPPPDELKQYLFEELRRERGKEHEEEYEEEEEEGEEGEEGDEEEEITLQKAKEGLKLAKRYFLNMRPTQENEEVIRGIRKAEMILEREREEGLKQMPIFHFFQTHEKQQSC